MASCVSTGHCEVREWEGGSGGGGELKCGDAGIEEPSQIFEFKF